MKLKILFGMILLFLGMNCFSACDDDKDVIDPDKYKGKEEEEEEEEEEERRMIWDFYPIVLTVIVQDTLGNDLLNPETEGSIADQGIKAIYKDVVYEKDSAVLYTRAYLAEFNGLQTAKYDVSGKYFLMFGEFDGAATFEKEEVVIDWNDGTRDTLNFSSKLTWKSINEPVFDREFLLNGEKNDSESGHFTIVK